MILEGENIATNRLPLIQVSFCQEASCFMKCETEFVPSLSNNLAKAEKLGGHFSLFLFLGLLLKQLLFLYKVFLQSWPGN